MLWAFVRDMGDKTTGELLTEGKLTVEDLPGSAAEKKAERERQETDRLQALLDSGFGNSSEPETIPPDF